MMIFNANSQESNTSCVLPKENYRLVGAGIGTNLRYYIIIFSKNLNYCLSL